MKQKFELIKTLMELEQRKETVLKLAESLVYEAETVSEQRRKTVLKLGKSPVNEAKTVSEKRRETVLDFAKVKEHVSKRLKDLSEQVVQQMQGDIDVRSKHREFELEQERLDDEVRRLETEEAPLADGGTQPNVEQKSYAGLADHLKKEMKEQLTVEKYNIRNSQLEAEQLKEQLKLAVELSGKEFCGVLCIGFDSESQGFASALARIFYRVGFINFSSHYKDYENPLRIDVNDASRIFSVTIPHDILMHDDLDVKDKNKKMSDKVYTCTFIGKWRHSRWTARKS
jgi:hypothetical protein